MPPLKKNEKIMLIVIGVMIVVFIAMDPYYFIYRKRPDAVQTPAAGSKQAAKPAAGQPAKPAVQAAQPVAQAAKPAAGQAAPAEAEASKPKREPIPFANWGRDPFTQTRRVVDESADIKSFKLGGISVRGDDRYALINEQIVHKGDILAGMTITSIEKDRVILARGSQTFTLTWGQQ